MRRSEEQMREILNREIQISDTVEKRIQDTYSMLGKEKKKYHKGRKLVAAAAAVLCLAVPGVAYASANPDFFQGLFGNETKKSTKAFDREIDDGKDGKVSVTIPSKEYVPVDTAKAEELVGKWLMNETITVNAGKSHTLNIEGFVYDRNGAMMYFTLEREGGVTAFAGDEDTNLTKGATFTDETDFYFGVETKKGVAGYENTYIDMEKSTSDKIYGYSYILWSQPLKEDDVPQLKLDTYPCARKELSEKTEIKTESIKLTDKGQVPTEILDLGEKGHIEYSPLSLSVDMAKGFGLTEEQAEDPYYTTYVGIKYRNGDSYVVSDDENSVDNSGYTLGSGTWYKVMYNRLVDPEEISEIEVNGVKFAL